MIDLYQRKDSPLSLEEATGLADQTPTLSGSDWLQMGQIRDFFRSDFRTFWRTAPKCSEIWSEKVTDLFHLRPIWPTLGKNLRSLGTIIDTEGDVIITQTAGTCAVETIKVTNWNVSREHYALEHHAREWHARSVHCTHACCNVASWLFMCSKLSTYQCVNITTGLLVPVLIK